MLESAIDGEKEELVAYFKKNEQWLVDSQDLVIVFWENGQPKKNGKIYKLLNKIGKTQNFEKLSGPKLNRWIVDRVSGFGAKISPRALNKLVLFAGNELSLLDNELQKLINFVDNGTIEEADVDLLVKANIDVNIFSTIDALANRNKKEALYLLHEHLKKGEDAFYVFSMIVYQFRNLIKVSGSMDRFRNDEYALGKEIGLHPYVVKKSLQQLRNFPLEKLKKIYEQLSRLDLQVKTGKLDIKLALDMFIVEL
jgi:DNA polymerase-3 subunit delta